MRAMRRADVGVVARNNSPGAITSNLDLELRNSIRKEVRKHSPLNWTWIRKLAIRCGINPFYRHHELILALLGLLCAIAIPVGTVALILGILIPSLTILWNQDAPQVQQPGLILAICSIAMLAFSFAIFAGTPSAKLHRCNLRYPRSDDSLHCYIRSRTILALVLIFVSSLISYCTAGWFGLVSVNPIWAIACSLFHSLFFISIVLICARRYVPSFEADFPFWGLGILPVLMLIQIPFVVGFDGTLFGYPEIIRDVDLIGVKDWAFVICNPQSWVAFVFYRGPMPSNWIGVGLLIPVTMVIISGYQSYQYLMDSVPGGCLDGDSDLDLDFIYQHEDASENVDQAAEDGQTEGRRQPANSQQRRVDKAILTEKVLFARINELARQPISKRDRFLAKAFPRPIWMVNTNRKTFWDVVSGMKNDLFTFFATKQTSWAYLGFAWRCCVALLLAGFVFAFWYSTCFRSSELWQCWFWSRMTCFGVMLLPIFATILSLDRNYLQSGRYPVDLDKIFNGFQRAWLRNAMFILPVHLFLAVLYGVFFGLGWYQWAALTIGPPVFSYGVGLLVGSLRLNTTRSVELRVFVSGLAITLLLFAPILMSLIPAPEPMILQNPESQPLITSLRYLNEIGIGLFVIGCMLARRISRSNHISGDVPSPSTIR